MAILGMRGTGDWGTDERPKNFREMILWRNPNGSAVLTALSAKGRRETVDDPEFSWWEEEMGPVRLQINGARTTGDTTIIVDSGDATNLVAGDVLLVEAAEDTSYSAELLQVTSVTSATQFVVTRGVAGTTAGTIADNVYLTRIGNAFEEGSASPDASTQNPTKFYNYTQIRKKSYRITGTAMETRARTGDPLKNDKKRKMFQLAVEQEYTLLFGKRYEDTSGTKPKRFTGGLLYFLAQAYAAGATHCIKIFTTTLTEDTFLDALYKVWDYDVEGGGSNERLILAGNAALNALNKAARNSSSTRINFDQVVRLYGMELQRWITPQGTVYVKTHPLMNVHGRYTNSMFVVNPSQIITRTLRNRDIKADEGPGGKGIQTPGADEKKGQWIGELGYEFHHLKTMAYFGGVQ